jgi:hypothetical protein
MYVYILKASERTRMRERRRKIGSDFICSHATAEREREFIEM